MFIGIDHGTTAMRFASETGQFKLTREEATGFSIADLERLCPPDEIEGIALCYSMGDNFSKITDINKIKNRGVVSREGAGKHIGGGTKVFDEIKKSGIPTIVIPGLHRGSPTDPRFKAYSHQSSPEKIGIAYAVCHDLGDDVVVSDASSNTVTLLVTGGNWSAPLMPVSLHRVPGTAPSMSMPSARLTRGSAPQTRLSSGPGWITPCPTTITSA